MLLTELCIIYSNRTFFMHTCLVFTHSKYNKIQPVKMCKVCQSKKGKEKLNENHSYMDDITFFY